MSRNKLLLVLGVSVSIFASCAKNDYTCKCDGGLVGKGMQVEIKQSTQSKAEKACKEHNGDVAVDGYTNCRLL